MTQTEINNFNTYRECESYLYNTWGKDEGSIVTSVSILLFKKN